MHQAIKLGLGCLFFVAVIYLAPIDNNPLANRTLALALLMVTWWVSDAIHFGLTSMLPLVALPLLNIMPISTVAQAYAHRLIFLFVGGFLIAAAVQKWQLHKRIALHIILLLGTNKSRLILGFMMASGFLSMWLTNIATTMMMLPIGLSVITYLKTHDGLTNHDSFPTVLMLSIAYASSIGGMATITGTAPNAFTVAYLSVNHDIHISFIEWFCFGLPFVMIALPLSYWVLTHMAFNFPKLTTTCSKTLIRSELATLGPMKTSEKRICIVFIIVVLAWMFQPWLVTLNAHITDAAIAMVGGCILFLIPGKPDHMILTIRDLKSVPWPILLLIGGGLALATAVQLSGLAQSIAEVFYFARDWNYPCLLLLVIITIITLSEFTSNTATTAAFIPIIAAVATNFGINPILLALPATLAASCAFMLPIATPPNAVVYATNKVTMAQMARAGIYMNALFIMLLFIFGMGLKYFL